VIDELPDADDVIEEPGKRVTARHCGKVVIAPATVNSEA